MGGAVGDHFGRRRMLIAGIVLFALASAGRPLAPDLPTHLASRAFKGSRRCPDAEQLRYTGQLVSGRATWTGGWHLGVGRRRRQCSGTAGWRMAD
ncbi:hypothetical protein [Sphingomonas sp. UYP23]